MPYYMGDYYQGDYYRGDPGFFSFIGKAIKGVTGLAGSVLGLGGGKSAVTAAAAPGALVKVSGGLRKIGPIVLPAIRKIGKGGAIAGVAGAAAGALGTRALMAGGAQRRHRRMNVTNVRALRRSIRRAQGFAKLAKRVLRFTSPRAPRGRAVFKTRTRKRIA